MITRVNRIPFSYVPGQPLGDYRVAFDREKGNLENFEIAQGVQAPGVGVFSEKRGEAGLYYVPQSARCSARTAGDYEIQ